MNKQEILLEQLKGMTYEEAVKYATSQAQSINKILDNAEKRIDSETVRTRTNKDMVENRRVKKKR